MIGDDQDIKKSVDALVSDTACCDRDGCRCWQAVADLKRVRDYCDAEIQKSQYEDLK
jgi:hypothetical protein